MNNLNLMLIVIMATSFIMIIFSAIASWRDSRQISKLMQIIEPPMERVQKRLRNGFNEASSSPDHLFLLNTLSYIGLQGQKTINKLTFALIGLTFALLILTVLMLKYPSPLS